MQVSNIGPKYYIQNNVKLNQQKQQTLQTQPINKNYAKLPCSFKYNANISFGEFFDPNRTVPHIDYEEYMAMTTATKKRLRKRYDQFFRASTTNTKEMVDQRSLYMPLKNEAVMEEFINFSKSTYGKYKDQPIICLGRSPKWFLNAALWMKDGINDYKFVAFSKYWHKKDEIEGMLQIPALMPTEKEEKAYFNYLKRIKADPKTIVDNMKETGKKTVITDYIHTSRGFCSFLDLMSKYAEEQGILEDFSKSIQLVNIASMEYLEELDPYSDSFSIPSVIMPKRLQPYKKNIKQEYYDMSSELLKNMLINQNTNECRSTYYPHETWTIYQPDRFKTGLIHDIKKVKELVKQLKASNERSMSSFTPTMYDFRNLLNFRILDALNSRKLLKAVHKSKI